MGIDIHVFNFLHRLADIRRLGDVLTIGRQSLCVDPDYIVNRLGTSVSSADGYCEPLLAALGARSVASIDYSDYENSNYVGDLGIPVNLGRTFDTVIAPGSLEHVFDVASAFRNIIRFCNTGGRIVHILPVNNLSGHGFWQFNSDIMYSVYSENNGFKNTEVYYASGIDFSAWYKISKAQSGSRVEAASIEPLILLCVTEKFKDIFNLQVVQPFYADAWNEGDVSKVSSGVSYGAFIGMFRAALKRRGRFVNLLRNIWFVFGLLSGRNRYSIRRFEKVPTGHALPASRA
jgi:SAM-dependent methyltransferase